MPNITGSAAGARAAIALLLALAAGARPVGQQADAAGTIADAAAALGGRERLLAVKTLTIEGYGINPNIGQAMTPEAEPLWWMLPDLRRSIDLERGRMEVSFTRRPAFPAVFDDFRFAQRLDGDVVFTPGRGGGAGAGGGAAQVGGQAARDLRLDMLRHPLTAVRAALDPRARVSNARATGTGRSVDVTTAQGDVFTLAVDTHNRPVSVRTAVYHPVLGDTERITAFDAYEDLDGVLLPKRFVQRFDRWVEYEIGVMKNTLDADLGSLEVPAAARAGATARGGGPPAPLQMQQVAPGIWYGAASLIVEFADHVTLIEVQNEARLTALLARARELVPGKPVTEVIVSHHHFDHAGGLRAAVAAGLTIVAQRVNEPWFREVVARPHTLVADALARTPRPLRLVSVEDSLTLGDAAMELTLYRVRGSTHSDGILMMHFPRQRFLVEADQWYGPPGQIKPHMRSLYADIRARGLAVDRMAVLHGNGVYTWQEFEASYADWCCRTSTTTSDVRSAPAP